MRPDYVIINDIKYDVKELNTEVNDRLRATDSYFGNPGRIGYFGRIDHTIEIEIYGEFMVKENTIGRLHIPSQKYMHCHSGVFTNTKINQSYPSNLYKGITTLINFYGQIDDSISLDEYYLTEDELIVKNIIE